MALRCFDHAFALADDSNVADVWYNIGQIAIGKAISFMCNANPSHPYPYIMSAHTDVASHVVG